MTQWSGEIRAITMLSSTNFVKANSRICGDAKWTKASEFSHDRLPQEFA
jgi:hypothetical protein